MNTLTPLLEASLRGALLIGILVLFRAPLRRLVGSPWLCALWLIVLLRLLLPGSIQSSWSLFNWWPEPKEKPVAASPFVTRVTVVPEAGMTPTTRTTMTVEAPAAQPPANGNGLFLLWATGALATMGMLGWRIFRTARMALSARPARNASLLQAFDSIPPRLRKKIELREVTALEVPALVGLWRPQIWMPTSWIETMNVEEIRHVLLHEIGHARRGDLWVQWLFAVVQCIHWFNPAVWIASRLAHADRELACDAWVLRRADVQEPEQYGATLIKAAQLLRSRWHLPPAAITMAMSKAGLFSRVRSIGQFQPVAGWRSALGFIGVGLLFGAVATDRLHAQSGGLAAPADPTLAPVPAAGGAPSDSPRAADPFGNAGGGIIGDAGAAPPAPQAGTMAGGAGGIAGAAVRQVEVEAKFLEVDMPEDGWNALGLAKFAENGAMQLNSVLDPTRANGLIQKLTDTKGMTVLSTPRVTTGSGQRAVIEIIREVRYATEFQPDAKQQDGLLPTAFETRNVGVTLEVEPVISWDGATIQMNLVPQIVEVVGFTRVRDGQPVELPPDASKRGFDRLLNVSLPKDVLVTPIFSTRKITTSVSLHSGNTLLLGGLKQPQSTGAGNPRVLFVLVTANIVSSNPGVAAAPALDPLPGAGDAGAGLAPEVVPGLEPIPGAAAPGAGIPGAAAPAVPGLSTGSAGAGLAPGSGTMPGQPPRATNPGAYGGEGSGFGTTTPSTGARSIQVTPRAGGAPGAGIPATPGNQPSPRSIPGFDIAPPASAPAPAAAPRAGRVAPRAIPGLPSSPGAAAPASAPPAPRASGAAPPVASPASPAR